MNTYRVHYSTGTSRHDEKRYTKTITASNIAEVAATAVALLAAKSAVITSIELDPTSKGNRFA
jgi:hypothetical protein